MFVRCVSQQLVKGQDVARNLRNRINNSGLKMMHKQHIHTNWAERDLTFNFDTFFGNTNFCCFLISSQKSFLAKCSTLDSPEGKIESIIQLFHCPTTAVAFLDSYLKHGICEESLQGPLLTVWLGLILFQKLVKVSVLLAVGQDLQAVLVVSYKLLVDV